MSSDQIAPVDPAADIALTADEILWLDTFLASDAVPDTAMPLEALDGFFTALVVGPETVTAAEYMPIVWDTEARTAPLFDDPGRLATLNDLLSRHWRAISRRIAAGYPHFPLLEDERPGQDGCAWCYGFMVGVGMRVSAWEPFLKNQKMEHLLAVITSLAEADELSDLEASPPEERAEIVEALAAIPLVINEFWHDRAAGLSDEQRRATRVGRNDPCPCGSGRKYKRCCGAGPRTLQ